MQAALDRFQPAKNLDRPCLSHTFSPVVIDNPHNIGKPASVK